MKELGSYQVELNKPLTTKQLIKLYRMTEASGNDVYLHQDYLIANAGRMPKLLSFFLFADIDKPIRVIIDGENVESMFHNIQEEWEDRITSTNCRKRYDETIMNSHTSITI